MKIVKKYNIVIGDSWEENEKCITGCSEQEGMGKNVIISIIVT